MGKVWQNLSERCSDLAGFVRHAVSFLRHKVRVHIYPLPRPVLDLYDPNARRANCDNVNFIGLELVSNGESEICQQNPCAVTRCGSQPALQLLEGI